MAQIAEVIDCAMRRGIIAQPPICCDVSITSAAHRYAVPLVGRRCRKAAAMPGHQFLKPEPIPASRPVRHFTLEEANKTLPLVKRIVADIVRTHTEVTKLQTELETAGSAAQDHLAKSLEHLQDYVEELTEIGCELKDYRLGLIDFIGRHEGRDVCLCWKLGEEKILFWHDIRAGFAGRQPITTLHEKA